MENTLENKAKFFAQYWGQYVIEDINNAGGKVIYPVHASNMYRFDESLLILKPLIAMTDDDALRVVEILKASGVLSSAMQDPQKFLSEMKTKQNEIIAPVADYLRLKGYAVPYMTLTVAKLIKYKWVKSFK